MTTNKRKKVSKYRAHTTHGGGHRKKRRGAGNRGGRGMAGSGKRGKANKQSYSKLGKHGFSSTRSYKKLNVTNISSLMELVANKKVEEKNGVYVVDLTALGYDKLLGAGKTNLKFEIKVKQFSKQAEEKIKVAGGSITSGAKKEEQTDVKEKEQVSKEQDELSSSAQKEENSLLETIPETTESKDSETEE